MRAQLGLDRRVFPPTFALAPPRKIEGEARAKAGGKVEAHTKEGVVFPPLYPGARNDGLLRGWIALKFQGKVGRIAFSPPTDSAEEATSKASMKRVTAIQKSSRTITTACACSPSH